MDSKEPTSELDIALSRVTATHDTTNALSYMIFGAAVTATRAFEKVTLKIDVRSNRIFVQVRLRWFFRTKLFKYFFKWLKPAWLNRAERRCAEQAPSGWKLLCYYDKDSL